MTLRINKAIWEYLRHNGYRQTEKHFLSEAQIEDHTKELLLNQDTDIIDYILFSKNSEASPETYEKSYLELKNWILSSLEIFQAELFILLYPIFVHCYLDLIRKDHIKEAQQFFENNNYDHMAFHSEELAILKSIQNTRHIMENSLARNFEKYKFNIKLSSYSFELFVAFLQDKNFKLLLGIVNQFINIRVVDVKELSSGRQSKNDIEQPTAIITGEIQKDIDRLNSVPVQWGLLENCIQDQVAEMKIQQKFEEEQKKLMQLKRRKRKIQKPTIPKQENRIKNSTILFPRLTQKLEESIKEELVQAEELSQQNLPSICLFTFFHSEGKINCSEVSAESRYVVAGFSDSTIRLVVSCSQDGTARLWSLDTKSNLAIYKGHNYPIWDVQFSPLGYHFVTASYDQSAMLWVTERVFPIRVFSGHLSDVDCVRFHPNVHYIATGSSDKTVRLWETNTANCVRIFCSPTGHRGGITSLAFSPDGRILASGSEDGSIILWDIGTGKIIRKMHQHESTVSSLDFSVLDGNILASGSLDNSVKIWDANMARLLPDSSLFNFTSDFHSNEKSQQAVLLLKSFPTKNTPVMNIGFSRRNILHATGYFQTNK
ncbi:transcription initiation factor tfiid [Anaeramoeba ignava]|uniref:Transcription initiation factor TFIID subunit 5 n=1 Tax=Anaeramoeba ignava TaxID=1746090 RepID=A0A9Q0LQT5_ANAIG|nr:transcription initiation factor tfiid [Anaeramoeba ignava]